MTITVKKAFDEFDKIITNFNDVEFQTKKTKVKNMVNNNIGKIKLHELVPSGSYGRDTAIIHGSDIDLVALVGLQIPHDKPKKILEDFEDKLKKVAINVEGYDHAFAFTYTNFKVDLVFAYGDKEGPWCIANKTTNKWDKTDPKKNKKLLNDLDQKCNGKAKVVMRFMKKWNKKMKRNRFKSFHLECIIYYIFQSISTLHTKSYSEIIYTIAPKIKDYINKSIDEPAKVGPKLLVKKKKQEQLENKLNHLIEYSIKAREFEKKNLHDQAIKVWKDVFGPQFGLSK